jgi:hypothetical protein
LLRSTGGPGTHNIYLILANAALNEYFSAVQALGRHQESQARVLKSLLIPQEGKQETRFRSKEKWKFLIITLTSWFDE